jgi:hypothetical protein
LFLPFTGFDYANLAEALRVLVDGDFALLQFVVWAKVSLSNVLNDQRGLGFIFLPALSRKNVYLRLSLRVLPASSAMHVILRLGLRILLGLSALHVLLSMGLNVRWVLLELGGIFC